MKSEISNFWAVSIREIEFSMLMRDWCMWFSNGYQHVIQGRKGDMMFYIQKNVLDLL
jgi:hypothetical protein